MKMPPPEKMPPNGNGRSPPNGRADELSHGERIAQLEVLIQNCATKTDLANLRAEMAELRGEMKAEMAALRGRMDALDEKIDGVKNELNEKIESVRTELNEKIESLRSDLKRQIESSASSTLKWMLGILLPFFTLLMTVFKFL